MKWRAALISILCTGLACSAGILATQAHGQGRGALEMPEITVLSPMGTPPPITLKAQAPRLDTLDGKTLYLVNTGFVGTERLMEVMTEWFAAHHPRTTIVNKRNPSMDVPDKALWDEIQEKADAVIVGLGH